MEKKLTNPQRELIVGSLLGDGHLRPHRSKVVFEFLQSTKRKFYVQWKHKMLGELACPQIYHNVGEREYYKLATKTHSELTEFYNLFYKGGRKIVPEKISKFLTPFAIAVWYMDDGSVSRGAAYFNTQGFNTRGQLLLIKALKRYHIIATLNRDGEYYRLRVLKRCNKRFLELVSPYILNEFKYKLPAR
ncbi:MAG: LAGLIDADG endonuclease [Candidatus Hadarchaeota archaeon]